MAEDRPPPSLADIEARLRQAGRDPATGRPLPPEEGRSLGSWYGFGLRISVEIVAALVVGVGAGLLLDQWLGTSPWGLIIMMVLGAGAAFVNVYRAAAGIGYAVGYKKPGRDPPAPGLDEGQDGRGN